MVLNFCCLTGTPVKLVKEVEDNNFKDDLNADLVRSLILKETKKIAIKGVEVTEADF